MVPFSFLGGNCGALQYMEPILLAESSASVVVKLASEGMASSLFSLGHLEFLA